MISGLSRLFRGRSKVKDTTDRETPLPPSLPSLSLVSEPRSLFPSYEEAPSHHPSYIGARSRHISYEGPRSHHPTHDRPRSRFPSQTSAYRSRRASAVSMPSSPRERRDALVPSRAHSNASSRASNAYTTVRIKQPRSRVQSKPERARDRPPSTVDKTPSCTAVPPNSSGSGRSGVESTATHEKIDIERERTSSFSGGGSNSSSQDESSRQLLPSPPSGPVTPNQAQSHMPPLPVSKQLTTASPPALTTLTLSTDSLDAPMLSRSYTTATINSLPSQPHSPPSKSTTRPAGLTLPTAASMAQLWPILPSPIRSPLVDRTPTSSLGSTEVSGEWAAELPSGELVDEVQKHKTRSTSTRDGAVVMGHRPVPLARDYTREGRYSNHSGLRLSPPSAPPTPAAQWTGWITPFDEDLVSDDHEREPNRVADWLSHTQSRHPDPPMMLRVLEDAPSANNVGSAAPQGHNISFSEATSRPAPATAPQSGEHSASAHVVPLSEPIRKETRMPEPKHVGDTTNEDSPEGMAFARQDSSGCQQQIADAQSSDDEPELVQIKTGPLSGQMSPESMFKCLVERGCPDITSKMNPERYSKGMVAAGGIGDIHRGELQDGTSVAIKMWRIFEYQAKSVKRATREIYNWSKMDHDNVHKLLGVIMLDGRIGMVSKWMDNGDLQAYIRKNQEIDRFDLCLQVTRGVRYLHNAGFVHGDLKAVNILVSAEGVPKLTDFDHSIILDGTLVFSETTQTGGGTSRWMAPELHADEAPCRNKQTDIYALGMTLLEIITGAVPYSECKNDMQVIRKLGEGKLPKRSEHFTKDERGRRTWELLLKCLDHTPDTRPTADSVLQSLSLLIDETIPPPSSNIESATIDSSSALKS